MDLIRWPAYKNAMRNYIVPGEDNQKATLDRRRIIQLLAAAMGLWARGQLPATTLLEAGTAHESPAAHLRRALQGNDSGLSAKRLGVWNAGRRGPVGSQHWLHRVYLRSVGKVSRWPVEHYSSGS